jgi:UTP:GlnB (protein PII) uridylyltransferase
MEMNSFVIHAAVVAVVAAGGYGRGDADAHCDVRAPGVRSME